MYAQENANRTQKIHNNNKICEDDCSRHVGDGGLGHD